MLWYQKFHVISPSTEISYWNRLMTKYISILKNKLIDFKKRI
jgi:hypothetical protein